MKIYEEDYKLVKQMRKKQRKRHPKWDKSKKLRLILWGITIVVSVWSGIYGYGEMDGILGGLLLFIGVFILSAIPATIYTIAISEICEDFIGRTNREVVILEDTMIKHGYHAEKTRICQYVIDELDYSKIKRIVYNTYHERIDIYGDRNKISYKDYGTGEVMDSRCIEGKNARMRLYLYFKDDKDLLDNILIKTNIQPEIINCEEE